jgi:hypothetical protein
MSAIPNLKRIRVSSRIELENSLRALGSESKAMLVLHRQQTEDSGLDLEALKEVLSVKGWSSGPRYTLNKALVGQVIFKSG